MTGRRGQLLIALLCGLLGFGLVVQVRSSSGAPTGATRPEDLVRILDDLTARAQRLRDEIDALRATRDRLASGRDQVLVALAEAQRRAQELGVLAGTVPASGPGVVLTISDPRGTVRAEVVLDAVQELRDAGAQVLQLDGSAGRVRIVAGSYFLDDPAGGLLVDGSRVVPPYRLSAVGAAATMAAALRIPGGVVDTVAAQAGARADVATAARVAVTALRRLTPPRYARPAPSPSGSS